MMIMLIQLIFFFAGCLVGGGDTCNSDQDDALIGTNVCVGLMTSAAVSRELQVEVTDDFQGRALEAAREHVGAGGLGQEYLPLAQELVVRSLMLATFRRKEVAAYWEQSALRCVSLSKECLGNVSTGDGCLRLGRFLLDPLDLGLVSFFFKNHKPERVVLERVSEYMLLHEVPRVAKNLFGHVARMGQLVIMGEFSSNHVEYVCSQLLDVGYGTIVQQNRIIALPWTGRSHFHAGRVTDTFVVNLDRDADKWDSFLLENNGIQKILPRLKRFRAVDGRDGLEPTVAHRHLFRVNLSTFNNPYEDHGFRKGVLGCALSHWVLWGQLSNRHDLNDLDAYIVLEDDARLGLDYEKKWRNDVFEGAILSDPRWDLIFLGFLDDTFLHSAVHVVDDIYAFSTTPRSYGGGTYGYIVRKRGAARLLERGVEVGIAQPIDWFMIEAFQQGHVVAYKYSPHLVHQKGLGSSTHETYPWSIENICKGKRPTGRSKTDKTFSSVTLKLGSSNLLPDFLVKPELAVSVPVNEFKAHYQCGSFCFSLSESPDWEDSDSFRCIYLLDEKNNHMDPSLVSLGSSHKLYGWVFDGDGVRVENTAVGPVEFRLVDSWVSFECSDALCTVTTADPEGFALKHVASLLCINESCIHIGGLPASIGLLETKRLDCRFINVLGKVLTEQTIELPEPVTRLTLSSGAL
mmetsp:Transcript_4096/g.6038  ORF Transcript_4096/g.6038 Transcript_4096/m.6038 type:complete len:687 (+) Transcript_4096:962-3022(+)